MCWLPDGQIALLLLQDKFGLYSMKEGCLSPDGMHKVPLSLSDVRAVDYDKQNTHIAAVCGKALIWSAVFVSCEKLLTMCIHRNCCEFHRNSSSHLGLDSRICIS